MLTREDGHLNVTRMSALVDQLAWLRRHDYEVILVSSGAVMAGRGELQVDHQLDSAEQRQLFSSVGQGKLIRLYYDLFREYNIKVGQVLTMKENFLAKEQYQNQKACMELMLENGVLPIVNENDTVCLTELMFTDNDELSGLIARMLNADALVLLSNVDGIYNGDPSYLPPASSRILRPRRERVCERREKQPRQRRHDFQVKDRPGCSQCRHQGDHCQRQYAKHPHQSEGASDGDPTYRVCSKT